MKSVALSTFLGLLLILSASQSRGADLELAYGSTFNRYETLHETGVINLALVTAPQSRFPTEWSFGVLLAHKKDSPVTNNDKATNWLGISKRLRWKWLFAGFGLVVVDQTTQQISSHVNFKSSAGVALGPLVGQFQHISNAGLHGTNEGDTFFTIGFRVPLEL